MPLGHLIARSTARGRAWPILLAAVAIGSNAASADEGGVGFPTLPNPAFAGRTGFGDFPDALAEMDANVGSLVDAVDALGIADETIVVVTSDNGPEATWPWQGSSGPWRGYYFSHMEGSLRAPFIIRWP